MVYFVNVTAKTYTVNVIKYMYTMSKSFWGCDELRNEILQI
jgi:hypothetical protein